MARRRGKKHGDEGRGWGETKKKGNRKEENETVDIAGLFR